MSKDSSNLNPSVNLLNPPGKISNDFVIPHSEVGDKPERGIGKTHGAATLNGP